MSPARSQPLHCGSYEKVSCYHEIRRLMSSHSLTNCCQDNMPNCVVWFAYYAIVITFSFFCVSKKRLFLVNEYWKCDCPAFKYIAIQIPHFLILHVISVMMLRSDLCCSLYKYKSQYGLIMTKANVN